MSSAPILVNKKTAAALLGISIGMLDKLVRQGRIDPVRLGRRVLFRRDGIEELTLTPRHRALLVSGSGLVQ
jgi:excisionase family DNA binding protein